MLVGGNHLQDKLVMMPLFNGFWHRIATTSLQPLQSIQRPLGSVRFSSNVAKEASGKISNEFNPHQVKYLDRALRVNHAGELAATLIYAAQTPVLAKSNPQLRSLMKHMHDQEAGHFGTFKKLLVKHRIRPTAMYPVWQVAATALGWCTAIMGKEAAMACTEAVEIEIGDHYNKQVETLLKWVKAKEEIGEVPGPELSDLLKDLRRIRDEELEHLDHALEHDAKSAKPYEALTNIVRGGCRSAIWVSERI